MITPSLRQYFFLHIPKTGGTSFRHMLWSLFPAGDVFPNDEDLQGHQGRYFQLAELMRLPPPRLQRCRLLCGHLPAVSRDLFASPPALLLFLRDPVARAISNLRHIQRRDYPSSSLSAIFENDELRTKYVTNRQSRMLSFRSTEEAVAAMDTMLPGRDRLELAKGVLERAEFVGLTEEFERSVELCERTFNWKFPSGCLSVNRSPALDEDLRALADRIRAEVELDQELYEFGRDLFNRRMTTLQ